jgi:hypothetical protein
VVEIEHLNERKQGKKILAPGGGLDRVVEPGLEAIDPGGICRPAAAEKAQSKVAGLYPGQATRATASPTAELIVRAFQGISLTVVEIAGQVRALLSPLSNLYQCLLKLLGLSANIYVRLAQHFLKPALNLSEL